MEVLAQRLKKRGADAAAVIQKRLAVARQEIAQWKNFDYLVISGDKQEDLRRTLAIIEAEKMRSARSAAPEPRKFFFHASSSFTASLLATVNSSSNPRHRSAPPAAGRLVAWPWRQVRPGGRTRLRARNFAARETGSADFKISAPTLPALRRAANRRPARRSNRAWRGCESVPPASAPPRAAVQNPDVCPPASRPVRRSQKSRHPPGAAAQNLFPRATVPSSATEIKMRPGSSWFRRPRPPPGIVPPARSGRRRFRRHKSASKFSGSASVTSAATGVPAMAAMSLRQRASALRPIFSGGVSRVKWTPSTTASVLNKTNLSGTPRSSTAQSSPAPATTVSFPAAISSGGDEFKFVHGPQVIIFDQTNNIEIRGVEQAVGNDGGQQAIGLFIQPG
jgi:hypothetical protein